MCHLKWEALTMSYVVQLLQGCTNLLVYHTNPYSCSHSAMHIYIHIRCVLTTGSRIYTITDNILRIWPTKGGQVTTDRMQWSELSSTCAHTCILLVYVYNCWVYSNMDANHVWRHAVCIQLVTHWGMHWNWKPAALFMIDSTACVFLSLLYNLDKNYTWFHF